MWSYIFKRVLQGIITVWFIATATFFAMHNVPGDPLLNDRAITPQMRANLEAKYGLDQPVVTQYFVFLGNLSRGDFGISFTQEHREVNDIIRQHFPVSAILGILAVVFAAAGGVLFGALTALYRNRLPDYIIMFLVILIRHMLVPALVLGLGTMAYLTRLMRSSMLEIISSDYVRTAKSKGVPPGRIFTKHQLRNAILPVVTVLGPAIAAITTGGFVVELVFAIPGLGRFFVEAVQQLDYTVIMGTTVFYGAFLVFMVIVVDVLYGFIDPKVRLE
jgi:ABC-type dipeptide/oligopeptide/nickel transport system permease component